MTAEPAGLRVDFYHLTRTPIEAVLPKLLEKILASGAKALVHGQDRALLDRLDTALWTYEPTAFLPHDKAGEAGEADQPVLLSTGIAAANDATMLVIVDGHWPGDAALGFDRTLYLFDDATLDEARRTWRSLACDRHYWKQTEAGGWVEGP